MTERDQQRGDAESPDRDMDELLAKLALIRAQVDADEPRSRFPSRMVGLLVILAFLALVPVLFSGPCGSTAKADEQAGLMKGAYDVYYENGVLYSALEYGLVTWDAAGKGRPAKLGALEIPGPAVSVSSADIGAPAAYDYEGVRTFDIEASTYTPSVTSVSN